MEYIEKIDGRIEDLDQFISEIIDYSRNSRLEVKNELIDLSDLIDQVYEKLKYMDGAVNIKLKTNLKIREIYSDHSRLNVILSNLIANSINYSDRAKDSNWIEIDVDKQNGSYVFNVRDNGIGIEKEHHERIYNMFYRADDNSKGSGLGLYIVKEMIEKLNGEIKVDSTPGVGTNLTIVLPQN